MINGLGVMTFGSRSGCWNSVLDSIEPPKKSERLAPIRMQSQETFNTNIVANFLIFLTAIYTLYSDKHNNSYSQRKVVDQRWFQQKAENIFGFGAGVRICSATELKEQIGHKGSRVHDPFQLRLNIEFGPAVC
jgi:hypothetical protein